jgi:hypothetical protein
MQQTMLRKQFRPYALDGAVQFFHPESGTNVRFTNARTSTARMTVPRVVMFGITNHCNLTCAFCSRDTRRESHWTVDTAFEVLRDLSTAGVLEVAFGGGEPFAFPGFDDLIARLYDETPLALNVTTNGTLIDAAMWKTYSGRLGQVRVSIYGDRTWRRCGALFRGDAQKWGANILVDDTALATLEGTLRDLATAGCADVSVLNYVGEPGRLLSNHGRRRLSEIISASPVPCRVSVCLGNSLGVPRLMAGAHNEGNCGAGSDFLTVTPDQKVQACSFHNHGFPGATAAEILHAWKSRRALLSQPATKIGCARGEVLSGTPIPLPEIGIWQAFSGNNSGECILVAKFQKVQEAESYLAELMPGWRPGAEGTAGEEGYSALWKTLFSDEQVATSQEAMGYRESPVELVQIGKAVIATGYGADDNFPELRALSWKRGGFVVPGGVHEHDTARLFAAVHASFSEESGRLVDAALSDGIWAWAHGRVVFLHIPPEGPDSTLAEKKARLLALAGDRPLSAEVYFAEWEREDMTQALKRMGQSQPEKHRLWVRFPHHQEGAGRAQRFAATFRDQAPTLGTNWLMFDPVLGRKRVAVLAYRSEGVVTALDAEQVNLMGYLWRRRPEPQKGRKAEREPMPAPETFAAAFDSAQGGFRGAVIKQSRDHNDAITVELVTDQPGSALHLMETTALGLGLDLWPQVSDPDPLGGMLRRLKRDVEERR